jgi:hypothetical protein
MISLRRKRVTFMRHSDAGAARKIFFMAKVELTLRLNDQTPGADGLKPSAGLLPSERTFFADF